MEKELRIKIYNIYTWMLFGGMSKKESIDNSIHDYTKPCTEYELGIPQHLDNSPVVNTSRKHYVRDPILPIGVGSSIPVTSYWGSSLYNTAGMNYGTNIGYNNSRL